jgi:enoyl-CoA hydratase
MTGAVLTERRERILLITLNRPDARNAIDSALTRGLLEAIAQLDDTDELGVGVLAGAGECFCAGLDLREFGESGPPRGLARLLRTGSRKPLVAAIEGRALGGGLELALLGDLLVAARTAELALPEATLGLVAGGGGLLRLPRHLPYAVAARLAFTGESISGEQAHRYGLVNEVSAPGGALALALELASKVSRSAPLALAASKQLLRDVYGRTEAEYWEHQRATTAQVFGSADAREGALAFAERRRPRWSGR